MAAPQYRASAMAHLASPEQLDSLVQVTRPRIWLALIAIGLVIAGFVTWTLVGTVRSTFPGPGVLLTEYGTSNIVTPETGLITDVSISSADEVGEGQAVATLLTDEGIEITITARAAGQVVEMLALPGSRLEAGEPVATIQPADDELYAFIWVSVQGVQPIKPGMPVQLSVTTFPSEEYGLLEGTVVSVGTFPVTSVGVDALLNNPEVTAVVMTAAPLIQVQVELTESTETASGYAWTAGSGPPEALAAGTLVNASVITAVQRPITLLFPSVREPQ